MQTLAVGVGPAAWVVAAGGRGGVVGRAVGLRLRLELGGGDADRIDGVAEGTWVTVGGLGLAGLDPQPASTMATQAPTAPTRRQI